jgi:ATP-dependent protease HslVU (ClpYQ) ATPase subunit
MRNSLLDDALPGLPEATGPRDSARPSIVLVGLPGAGKSALGRRISTLLGLPFRDADTEI